MLSLQINLFKFDLQLCSGLQKIRRNILSICIGCLRIIYNLEFQGVFLTLKWDRDRIFSIPLSKIPFKTFLKREFQND